MASKVEIKAVEALAKMHTGTLMKRREALLKCEESYEKSDHYDSKSAKPAENSGLIEFKDTPEWIKAYSELKNILATRENIPNKLERKEIRRKMARSSK